MVNDLLGDRVARAMERLGVTNFMRVYFPDCNCEARRKWLNWLHRYLLGATQTKYLAAAKDHPGQYAVWCNRDGVAFLTEDKERACHFETREGCLVWCEAKGRGTGTPLFVPLWVVLI